MLGVLKVSMCNGLVYLHTEVDCPEDLNVLFMGDVKVDVCPVASKTRPRRLFGKVMVITSISRVNTIVATEAWDDAIK